MGISNFLKSIVISKELVERDEVIEQAKDVFKRLSEFSERDYSNVVVKSDNLIKNTSNLFEVKSEEVLTKITKFNKEFILSYEEEFINAITKYVSKKFIKDQASLQEGLILGYIYNISAYVSYLEDFILYTIYKSENEEYIGRVITNRLVNSYTFITGAVKDFRDDGLDNFISGLPELDDETVTDIDDSILSFKISNIFKKNPIVVSDGFVGNIYLYLGRWFVERDLKKADDMEVKKRLLELKLLELKNKDRKDKDLEKSIAYYTKKVKEYEREIDSLRSVE